MENVIDIQFDKYNIYVNLKIKPNPFSITILSIFVLLLCFIFAILTQEFLKEKEGSVLLPIIILFIFFLFLPIRYLLWNLFGRETLIINAKSISFYRNYGLIETNLKTINYNQLGIDFNFSRERNGIKLGQILFYDYLEENNLPKLIHETTILIDLDQLTLIESMVHKIFVNQFKIENKFIGFSLN